MAYRKNDLQTTTPATGDLSGTLGSPTVAKLNGVTVSGTPAAAQVLTATSTTAASWSTLSSATALTTIAVQTAAYTATLNQLIPCDATSGAFTVTLPTGPADKTRVVIKKIDSSTNPITVACGGSDVFNKTGGSTSGSLLLPNQALTLQYAASSGIWYISADDLPLSQLDIRYAQQAKVYNAKSNSLGITLVGDGVTNDQANFASLIAAIASAGGGTLYCPASTYLIKDHGTYWKSGVSLVGDGPGKTIFKLSNTGTGLPVSLAMHSQSLSQASFANAMVDCQFRDFEIDGSAVTSGGYQLGAKGLNMQFMIRARFDNVYIHDTMASGLGCDFLLDSVVSRVRVNHAGALNNGTTDLGGGGFGIGVGGYRDLNQAISDAQFTTGSNILYSPSGSFPTSGWSEAIGNQPLVGALVTSAGNVSAGTTVTAIVDATHLQLSTNATATSSGQTATLTYTNSYEYLNTIFSSCVSTNSGKHGMFFEAQSSNATYPYSKGIKVIGCTLNNNVYGLSDWGCDGLVVSDCDIANNSKDGINLSLGGVTSAVGRGGEIHHSRLRNNTRDGIRFEDCSYSSTTSGYTVSSNRIEVNGISGTGGYGVNIVLNTTSNIAKYIRISQNLLATNGGAGIHTTAACDNSEWDGNLILNNGQNTSLTTAQRAGICVELAASHLGIKANRMTDDQATKTQQNAFYYTPTSTIQAWQIYDNDGLGNVNTGSGISATASFAFPNITVNSPASTLLGNNAIFAKNNIGLNTGQSIVAISAGATPASAAVYRVGGQPEDLWFSISGGTMTSLKIGIVAIPGVSGGVTTYGPLNCDPNDGVTPTYTGTLTMTSRPR